MSTLASDHASQDRTDARPSGEADGEKGFQGRLKRVVEMIPVAELARRSGLSDPTIRNYLKGVTPSLDRAAKIAQAAGVRLEWLATGRGPMREGEEAEGGPVVVEKPEQVPEGWVVVPERAVTVGAGGARFAVESEQIVSYWAFRRDWLHRQGIEPGRAALVEVAGQSMEPLLRAGDLVLVDLAAAERPFREGLWVVWYGGLVVKHVQPAGEGRLRLVSENRKLYPPEVIELERTPDFRLVGLVRWMARRV